MSNPRCPGPTPTAAPGFLRLLDVDAMARLVQQHLTREATLLELVPDCVRWKDQDGLLVGYRAKVRHAGDETATYVTARTAQPHRLAHEAERLTHRAEQELAGLRAFALVPGADLLLLGFPLDRAMHDLRRVVRPSKVRTLVASTCPSIVPEDMRFSKRRSAFRLVRYKPERRAVLHWQVGLVEREGRSTSTTSIWIRCHAENQAQRTAVATAAAAAGGVRCPRTLGIVHDRLTIESHVDGRTWDPFAGNDAALAKAAAVVTRLHGTTPPSLLPHHGALDELDLALRAVEDLGRLDARLGSLAHELADRLSELVPASSPPVFAHGDLHPGQVLLTDDAASLCDFDRACLAPAAYDLATMRAHCVVADPVHGELLAQQFLDVYGKHRELPHRDELAWWSACALLRCATTPFRSLRHDWPAATAALLDHAGRALRTPAQKGAQS